MQRTILKDLSVEFSLMMIFSTYPTMMNVIDEKRSKDGRKLFTSGHFDLIIIDESHRSIYKKYGDIFQYFDAMLLGLTATPKDDIDKNTYSIFELENNVPTFSYELEKAVEGEFGVDYRSIEVKSKFIEKGIYYDDLSDEEKDEFEKTFEEDENIDDNISNSAINEWLFNGNTPVTKLVRKIVGLQREAANEAFSKFLSEENLNVIQIRFVKLIVDYIVANGIIDDNRVEVLAV